MFWASCCVERTCEAGVLALAHADERGGAVRCARWRAQEGCLRDLLGQAVQQLAQERVGAADGGQVQLVRGRMQERDAAARAAARPCLMQQRVLTLCKCSWSCPRFVQSKHAGHGGEGSADQIRVGPAAEEVSVQLLERLSQRAGDVAPRSSQLAVQYLPPHSIENWIRDQ